MKSLKSHFTLPIFLQSYRLTVLLSLLLLLSSSLFAQNEANVWYFPQLCGLDYNSGEPAVLDNGPIYHPWANATLSDSSGNYLFCCGGENVYDKTGSVMQNGANMRVGGMYGRAIVKWPGQEDLYYLFTAENPAGPYMGFYYSIVDLKLNEGKGAVIARDIPVEAGWDASDRIATVNKENSEGVWVIVRKNEEDAFAAFLVDENGFHPEPVISVMPDREPNWESIHGYIKISSDKNYLVSTYTWDVEICSFNSINGTLDYMYTLTQDSYGGIAGIEFSPDSKYLYLCSISQGDTNFIYQYEMQFVSDWYQFINSAIIVGAGHAYSLQLARNGKIYCTNDPLLPEAFHYYVGVINNPWIKGSGCLFENDVINLFPHKAVYNFPNVLVDYLLRFEWAGEPCQGYPIHFKPNFIPTPQTIQWDFDDGPGSNSWQLSPTHTFKNPGVHEIQVDVWYPSGRYEHTSREIEISPSPLPILGNDTLICNGASITLNANCQADFFSWSTSQFGVSSITVSDSGTYWVRGRFNDSGCMGYDTIHIGYHPPTIIDETNLQIIPTTCNGSSGSITGLIALGPTPYAFQWLDLSGNDYGTNIDATSLPAGQYQFTITDGNGCETVSDVYTIEDAGNLQVLNVELTQPHCGRSDGQIIVNGFNPSGAALQYSIDDGATYQADSVFSGLVAAGYVVRVKDGVGCFGFYIDNPVLLEDIPGPQVQPPVVTDETDFLGNGSVEITATGSTTTLYYSNDNGNTYQSNNGTFNNLTAGTYICIVKDENDCDTTFTVEIQNIILTYLHAVTGEEGICEDSTTLIPVNVDNFNNVADFHLKLGYNVDNLECEGFTNIHPQLLDSLSGWVDPLAGDIHLAWNSPASVTFIGTEKVADLVFTTKNPGQGELAWYTGTTESYFTNAGGNPIPAEFQTGEVKIYEPPEIILDQSKTVCTGQFANLMSIAIGNQPPLTFRWIYPTGDTTSNDPFFFNVTQADAGLYTLLATDRVGCTDQKSIELIVSENPVVAFHGTDTLEMQTGDVLDAGTGLSSYLWNTGDSTESIIITAEGMYKVEMESPVGCLGSDSVYVKLVSEEIPDFNIYVPNAFSPNGDGINDIFQIKFPHSTFNLQHSTLSIFNRWGEEIFQSDDIHQGWDGKKNGKDCPGGVYVYKIVFSLDGVPGNQERVGTVMLIK
jgi:gliding motility-associated-like protein